LPAILSLPMIFPIGAVNTAQGRVP
jgi:hypothetical protein